MKPIHKLLALAALVVGTGVAGTATPSLAQGMGPGMMGSGGGMHGGFANAAGYLDSLKTELGITAAQADAWKSYADTVTKTSEQMQAQRKAMYESMATMSWEQRQALMTDMFKTRQQSFDAVHGAAEKLVATLDDAQRAKAASILPGYAARGPGMMRGGGMMGRPSSRP